MSCNFQKEASVCDQKETPGSGRTDSQGGHYNRSTGEYHFHHRAGARHPSADSDDDWRFIDDHPVITFIVGALVLGVFINLIERRGKRPF